MKRKWGIYMANFTPAVVSRRQVRLRIGAALPTGTPGRALSKLRAGHKYGKSLVALARSGGLPTFLGEVVNVDGNPR